MATVYGTTLRSWRGVGMTRADTERPVETIEDDDGVLVIQRVGSETEWIECELPAHLPG